MKNFILNQWPLPAALFLAVLTIAFIAGAIMNILGIIIYSLILGAIAGILFKGLRKRSKLLSTLITLASLEIGTGLSALATAKLLPFSLLQIILAGLAISSLFFLTGRGLAKFI